MEGIIEKAKLWLEQNKETINFLSDCNVSIEIKMDLGDKKQVLVYEHHFIKGCEPITGGYYHNEDVKEVCNKLFDMESKDPLFQCHSMS